METLFSSLLGLCFLIICVTAIILLIKQKSPEAKGKRGEIIVSKILHKLDGTVYDDYMLVDENNISHQIDHIFINASGIYVIETKNYAGRIYGNDNQNQWTQVLAYGKAKNYFYNPIKQNYTHIIALKKILPKTCFYLCVVFTQSNIQYINSNSVFTPKGLKKYICSNSNINLSEKELIEINQILSENRNTDKNIKEHVAEIKQRLNDVEKNEKCPRCGGKLILREGKYGSFYGCENYPKCKFKKNK